MGGGLVKRRKAGKGAKTVLANATGDFYKLKDICMTRICENRIESTSNKSDFYFYLLSSQ